MNDYTKPSSTSAAVGAASSVDAARARVERKLDMNEEVLWVGKPVPSVKVIPFLLIFGLFWSSITSVFVVAVVTQLVREPSWSAVLPLLFMIPFVCVGISTLFHPLWNYIGGIHTVYAVTTKRAMRLLGPFTTSWRRNTLFDEIDRADHRNGRSDLFFASDCNSRNVSSAAGFMNLPTSDADAAQSALEKLIQN